MGTYSYQLFLPGGNKTALVLAEDSVRTDATLRKLIQDRILARHATDLDGEVEQVGFISPNPAHAELVMAGGEFCGNATRSAAAYYLNTPLQEIEILVSGASSPLRAGLDASGEVWAEMPVTLDLASAVSILSHEGLYWVALDGISHLVVSSAASAPYLAEISRCTDNADKLRIALSLLEQTIATHALCPPHAAGVMFLEDGPAGLVMHPFVHVYTSGTTYYETGCGSGAMCVGLVYCLRLGGDVTLPLLQPSGKVICAHAVLGGGGFVSGKISGPVSCGVTLDISLEIG